MHATYRDGSRHGRREHEVKLGGHMLNEELSHFSTNLVGTAMLPHSDEK